MNEWIPLSKWRTSDVEIYDVLGEKVAKTFLSVANSSTSDPDFIGTTSASGGQIRIDISHLPRGVYYVKIGERVEKFVKR